MSNAMDKLPTVGDAFPQWSLPTLDGPELSSEKLQGKRVLLFMWGSW